MSKKKINIWGRSFELEIVYDCYQGEQVLPVQTEALRCFLENGSLVGQSLKAVEDYCMSRNAEEIEEQSIDDIFKYVMPQFIYVQRTAEGSHVIGLMCAYKFDIEHGIAVVFKNEAFEKVGSQDILL